MISLSRVFLLTALVATPLLAANRIERTVERSFTVPGAGTLHVETQGGEIRVSPGSDRTVKVTAREKIRAGSEAEADELLKKLELTIEQSGNDISARAKYERQLGGFHWGSWPPVQVDFIVTVPAEFATDLHTSGGSIVIGDLAGKAYARTSGGDIKLGRMGGEVNVKTSGGNIALGSAAADVSLETSGGDITAGAVAGKAALSTSGGGIRLESVAGAVRAHTSGGSIKAAIAGALKEECSLSTSGGDIRVSVEKSAAFRLDASTSGGGVHADGLTITMENGGTGRSKLAGAVNGGGPTLKLRTSGGSIHVVTK
jgi:hypothetical protein